MSSFGWFISERFFRTDKAKRWNLSFRLHYFRFGTETNECVSLGKTRRNIETYHDTAHARADVPATIGKRFQEGKDRLTGEVELVNDMEESGRPLEVVLARRLDIRITHGQSLLLRG